MASSSAASPVTGGPRLSRSSSRPPSYFPMSIWDWSNFFLGIAEAFVGIDVVLESALCVREWPGAASFTIVDVDAPLASLLFVGAYFDVNLDWLKTFLCSVPPAGRFGLSSFELMSRSESCFVKLCTDFTVFSLDAMMASRSRRRRWEKMEGMKDHLRFDSVLNSDWFILPRDYYSRANAGKGLSRD